MANKTDPAEELARLLDSISPPSALGGSQWLAQKFEVDEWSLDFYQIIFSIIQRIEDVRGMLSSLDEFEHLRADMDTHLNAIKSAFFANSLQNNWQNHGAKQVNAIHIQPLKMCSAVLRRHIPYPHLTEKERNEVVETVKMLLEWLKAHQIEENDFIRQAIIDGLEQFLFRIERLEWLGWGYSLDSLKSVVMAYIALESGLSDESAAPNAGAVLKKVGVGLKKIFGVVGVSKEIIAQGDFALKAYGAVSLTLQGTLGIAGLLS